MKKGFTLVELLGVIIIMAIIILIATTGYGKIAESTKQKSYESLVKLIETKAANFADETGELITNVQKLVELGYLEGDNEQGEVIDPRDGVTVLNCHLVSIINDSNMFYGQFSEEENCDLNSIQIINTNLNVNSYKTDDTVYNPSKYNFKEKLVPNTWTNTNVYLEATLGEKIDPNEIVKITWQSNAGKEERIVENNFSSQNKYLVTAEQLINTVYYVSIELKNKTVYQTNIIVKIDKQRPVILEHKIDEENTWTNHTKKITVYANDGNGSGVYGYYIGENRNCKTANYTAVREGDNPNVYDRSSKKSGDYYICVMDNAGNVSEDYSTYRISIRKVDITRPSCGSWSGESTAWVIKGSRTISVSCIETANGYDQSGCSSSYYSRTYSRNTKTDYASFTIYDNVGNSTTCSKTANIYVDDCSETKTVYGSWGSCSKSCEGGTKKRSWKKKSTFGSDATCESGQSSTSCNTHECPKDDDGNTGNGDGNSDEGNDSGGGSCSYAPDGTSNCYGMCGSPNSVPGHCCTSSGPCK